MAQGTQEAQVIHYLRERDRDNDKGFKNGVTWLGAEQCFVGPIRNSSLNNFEEQYVLGTDTYTITYDDEEGNHHIETCFCKNEPSTERNYYYLNTIKYNEKTSLKSNYGFEGTRFYVPDDENEVRFEGTRMIIVNTEALGFSEEGLKVSPSNVTVIREDMLYFIQDPNVESSKIKVWKKETGIKYDLLERKITQEVITDKF